MWECGSVGVWECGGVGIPMLVVCNMCLILTVSYYILLRMAEPQLGLGMARDGG